MVKKQPTILIVEDEKAISKALENGLVAKKINVQIAEDGAEALKAISKQKFDLMLLDLMLPKHDGYEVMETLKREHKEIPIIVLTNLSQEEEKDRSYKLGALIVFVKSNVTLESVIDYTVKHLSHAIGK